MRNLRKYLRALREHLPHVATGADVEFVHQSRVASRRVRAALQLFGGCFPGKAVKSWDGQLQAIIKGLGPARDLDVQTAFLAEYLAQAAPADRAGVARLLTRLRQCRDQEQLTLFKVLQKARVQGLCEDMPSQVEKLRDRLKKRQVPRRNAYLVRQTHGHITERLEELLGASHALDDAYDCEGHHRMRIVAKKLRYTMEFCRSVYRQGPYLRAVKAVKQLQTLLGDLHDCDVWVDFLAEFIQDEYRRTFEYFGDDRAWAFLRPGLEGLLVERQRMRLRLYRELTAHWEQLRARQTLTGLRRWLDEQLHATEGNAPDLPPPPRDVAADTPTSP